jgi:hypothetical protein
MSVLIKEPMQKVLVGLYLHGVATYSLLFVPAAVHLALPQQTLEINLSRLGNRPLRGNYAFM